MEQVHPTRLPASVARQDRTRMLLAIHDLEQALASASFSREGTWGRRISESLAALHTALRETRETADVKGGQFEELVQDYPRLQGRAERLRRIYHVLQAEVESVRSTYCERLPSSSDDVDAMREQLATLLAKVRRAQAAETELFFEAYQVDIGVGD